MAGWHNRKSLKTQHLSALELAKLLARIQVEWFQTALCAS